jgi:hypothetical protein
MSSGGASRRCPKLDGCFKFDSGRAISFMCRALLSSVAEPLPSTEISLYRKLGKKAKIRPAKDIAAPTGGTTISTRKSGANHRRAL